MGASSYGLLDAANSNTIEGFLQHGRKRSEKLRSRGGFQPAFPLYHMNRHKQQTPEKTKTESKPQTRKTYAN
jgi:hypothetical protein